MDSSPAEPQGKPKHSGVGSLSLLQPIFLTQELNRGLLHCRRILYQMSYLSLELYLELYLKWAYDTVETGVAVAAEIAPFIKYLLRPR